MSHTVDVKLIANQIITVGGQEVNVHDIIAISIDGENKINAVSVRHPDPHWIHENGE